MEVLFVQTHSHLRSWKIAKALKKHGINVDMAYTSSSIDRFYKGLKDDVYRDLYKITTIQELRELAETYRIVHSFNEPDELTVWLKGIKTVLIHDTADMISLRPTWDDKKQEDLREKEATANRCSDGRIYTCEFTMETAAKMYGIDKSRSLVYGNYVNEDDIPTPLPDRINAEGVHLVYEGGLNKEGTHRDFRDIFKLLTDAGVHVHVYPPAHNAIYAERLIKSPYLHIHESVSPNEIVREIAKYDYGIIPWNIFPENKTFLDQSMPNKLFEYLAAGLPVIVPLLYSLEEFLNQTGAGVIYDDPQDIPPLFGVLEDIKKTKVQKHTKIHEKESGRLISFYRDLLGGRGQKRNLWR